MDDQLASATAYIDGEIIDENGEAMELSPLLQILTQHKRSAFNWQQRRHEEWTENYTLYRNRVIINPFTQRQSVNLPLMKVAVRTALKDIDDPPLLYFENRDNDMEKELFYNSYFEECARQNKLVIKDIVDKKQVFLYGRSFKKLNIVNGKFFFEILDPQDILLDRYVDPSNIDTARYICHQHIFKPLSSLEENENYDANAVKRLKSYMATAAGLLKADENLQTLEDRNDRMRQMGVPDIDNPVLGETYTELNEHYLKRWDEEEQEDQYWLIVTAEGRETLLEEKLENVIGKTKGNYWRYHVPLTMWADDVERTDVWSDGMADDVRMPNKILNSWFSQLVENRTLRNFGMNFYDSTKEGFTPQIYDPEPFGWFPLPGKPADVYQRVDIPDLGESIDEMNFLINMVERVSASSATQQGLPTEKKITLGEIQLTLAEAKERVKSTSVFYNDSWLEFGEKYIKMLEAAEDLLDDVTLYKKGLSNGKIYARDVKPSDWRSKAGYSCRVLLKGDRDVDYSNRLQKFRVALTEMPDNVPLREIYQEKMVEFIELTPDEARRVLDFEKQKQNMLSQMGGIMPGQPMMGARPVLPAGQAPQPPAQPPVAA
jgi:hypothetical protein